MQKKRVKHLNQGTEKMQKKGKNSSQGRKKCKNEQKLKPGNKQMKRVNTQTREQKKCKNEQKIKPGNG